MACGGFGGAVFVPMFHDDASDDESYRDDQQVLSKAHEHCGHCKKCGIVADHLNEETGLCVKCQAEKDGTTPDYILTKEKVTEEDEGLEDSTPTPPVSTFSADSSETDNRKFPTTIVAVAIIMILAVSGGAIFALSYHPASVPQGQHLVFSYIGAKAIDYSHADITVMPQNTTTLTNYGIDCYHTQTYSGSFNPNVQIVKGQAITLHIYSAATTTNSYADFSPQSQSSMTYHLILVAGGAQGASAQVDFHF